MIESFMYEKENKQLSYEKNPKCSEKKSTFRFSKIGLIQQLWNFLDSQCSDLVSYVDNNWIDATPVEMAGGEGVGWGGDSPGPTWKHL